MHEVIRFDRASQDADPTLQPRLVEWVRSLGLNPDELLPEVVILKGVNEYELHASQIVRKVDGSRWIDEARCAFVTEPVVVGLGQLDKPSWPIPRRKAV